MEIYVKCGIKKHAEVPFSFGVRTFGESKLSPKVIGQYLRHLGQLYQFRHPAALLLLLLFVLFVLYAIAKRIL
jgi:dolichol-phosphate mannosyltransferase